MAPKSNMRQISPWNLAANGEEHPMSLAQWPGSPRVEDSKPLSAVESTDGIWKTAPMQCLKARLVHAALTTLKHIPSNREDGDTPLCQAWSLMHTSTLHPYQ